MMDSSQTWAAWGPTIVAFVTMVFTAGLLVGKLRDLGKTQDQHTGQIGDLDRDVRAQAISIAKLEAWRDGYNAATFRINHQSEVVE
jgi:hypothetical protein